MRTLSILSLSLVLFAAACSDSLTAPVSPLAPTSTASESLTMGRQCLGGPLTIDTLRISLPRLPRVKFDTLAGVPVGRDSLRVPCPTIPKVRPALPLLGS